MTRTKLQRWAVPVAALAAGALALTGSTAARPAGPGAGAPAAAAAADTATVVLLHGLGRTERSMARLARALEADGYRAVNLGYQSRSHTVAVLVDSLSAALDRCCGDAPRLHFVTHSLGGIMVRAWAHQRGSDRLGRVVMLSPPNQGTGVVDQLPRGLLELVAGPASVQLGTDSGSVPVRLPPADFELGIITGDASINPLFSWWLEGDDDGMVPVRSAWVEGAADSLVVPYSHTFIMRSDRVIEEVLAFLATGRFTDGEAP